MSVSGVSGEGEADEWNERDGGSLSTMWEGDRGGVGIYITYRVGEWVLILLHS